MAAITKRLLHLRPTLHSHARPYPYTLHHFSSSSDRDDLPQTEQPQTESSDSSPLDAVKASLRNLSPSPERPQTPPFAALFGASQQRSTPSQCGSRDEISARLAEFRARSAPPPPNAAGQYISMQELYEKNLKSNDKSSAAHNGGAEGRLSVDSIRQSLSNFRSTGEANPGRNLFDSLPSSRYTKNKADPNVNLGGGSVSAFSPFLKGAMGKGAGDVGSRKMGFGRTHDHLTLGERLKAMRPEKRTGKWFSLQELSNRLAKVRAADQKELQKAGFPVEAIYQSFQKITQDKDQQKRDKAQSYKNISLLGSMVEETGPPKDHLVETYFHPDNMSSAEKMKLELKKVRNEFKMSESDCGSARVQVAQLTTKIKHLSAVLHKKDKHSRKGLNEMLQRRKKLLKYLRRTDWESYCFVISKLGLRDNPDFKT